MKTKTKNEFTGIITALATPFNKGEVDFISLKRLLKNQLDDQVEGFVVNGTTAESPTLSREEVKKIFDFVKSEVAGQVPLILGTGSNSTGATVEFTHQAKKWGANGVLVVVPYYNKPPQRGLVAHFKEVAKASEVPVVIYNVPSRTITGFDSDTVAELSREPNIVAIKEATGNIELLDQMRSVSSSDFIFLSGDDGTFVDFCNHGGRGVISVSSHVIAKEMKKFMLDRAAEEYRAKYGEFMRHLFIEANPIPLKMVLYWMGVFSSPELRLPLVSLDEKFHKEFKECLKKIGLI